MRAETLRTYFESESQQRRALDAYFDAWKGRWPVHEMLDLYKASQSAFNSSSTANGAFQHFEKIYDELTCYWQVFRPYNRAECWPPPQIFETIKREFPEFSWHGPVNLLNFLKGGTGLRLESCLAKMQGIKPHKGYPVMAASKFLHFYNPGLFPIYDYEVIWKKVFCRFRKDFRDFCSTARIPYDVGETALFLRNYMCWGSSLLSVAHPTFMAVFIDWLAKEPGTELSKRGLDVTTLYATAFEFTAIGAAVAS